MARLEIEIGAVNDELKKILQDSKIALNNFAKEVNGSKGALSGLSQSSANTRRAIDEQRVAQERAKTATMQARQASAELTLQNRLNKQSTDASNGSYREAQQRLTALGASIRNAAGGFTNMTPEIRKQIQEYNKLNSKLKEFDRAMGNNYRNVGNYGSAFASAIPVIGQLTTVVGALALAQQGLSKSFSTNLKFDALEYSIRQVSTSAANFTDNMNFLRETSDRLGLDLMTTSQSFKLWQGAAKFSNLTALESRDIFESVANASAKMKLSADDTQGAIRALSQMMSKGKIQAEELRGQLGERIPGAFALAAQAMGVTEAELNKMMETGKLVANDFLPKFAAQLDKSFGNDKTQKIESMQASVNRLSTEFDLLWRSENMTKFFTKALDGFALMANQINRMINSKSWNEFKAIAFGSVEEHQRFVDQRDLTAGQRYLKGSGFSKKSLDEQKKAIGDITNQLNTAVKAYNDFYKTSASDGLSVNQAMKKYEELGKNVKMYSDALAEANKQLSSSGAFDKKGTLGELISDKGGSKSKATPKSIEDILPSLQGNDGNYYDQKLAKINSEYLKLVASINKSVGDREKISEALGLAKAKKDFDEMKVIAERMLEVLKRFKQTPLKTISGELSGVGGLSPTEWERRRLNTPRISNLGKDNEKLQESLSKVVERGFRQGLDSIFSEIDDLGSNFYQVFTNVFGKLSGSVTKILTNVISTQLGNAVSKSWDSDALQIGKLGSGVSKAIIAGAGLAGQAMGSLFKATSQAGQGIAGGLSGAASGFAVASAISSSAGPWGAAIGGLLGVLSGIFGAKERKRQEKLQEQALEEQRKQTALQQRMAALTFTSSIVGQQTNQGIVVGASRNEFGDFTIKVEGRDLVLVYDREKEAQKRGL